jgi:hypothetical protein
MLKINKTYLKMINPQYKTIMIFKATKIQYKNYIWMKNIALSFIVGLSAFLMIVANLIHNSKNMININLSLKTNKI